MEINTVPQLVAEDAAGNTDSKLPRLSFPVVEEDRHVDGKRVAVAAQDVPAETGGPHSVVLIDGSKVTDAWDRFVDQPSFQQDAWSEDKKAALQAFVERILRAWPIDRDHLPPPTSEVRLWDASSGAPRGEALQQEKIGDRVVPRSPPAPGEVSASRRSSDLSP